MVCQKNFYSTQKAVIQEKRNKKDIRHSENIANGRLMLPYNYIKCKWTKCSNQKTTWQSEQT